MVKFRTLRNAEAYVTPSIGSSEEEEPPKPPPKTFDVSDVIEMLGFGRYQWKVVFVMGLMSFADSCEIWLSSIILKMLVCEWNLSVIEMALIPATVLFFYAIGSIMSGKFADKFGRWPCLLIAYYVICITGVLSAFATSYYFFIIVRSITGFGIGASYGVSVSYTMEFVPKSYRYSTSLALNMFWIAGSVYECVVAIFVMDLEGGWRIQIILTAIPCFFTLFFLHFCDESPRYLAVTDQSEAAREVLEKISKANGYIMPPGEIVASQQRRGEYKDIYKQPFTRTSIVVTIIFWCNMWLGYGIVFLVPDMMSHSYCYMSEFFDVIYITKHGCINYTKAEYIFFLVIIFCCLPGYVLGPWTCEKFGRLPTFYYSTWGSLVSTTMLLFCFGSIIIYIELFFVALFYMAMDAVLWIYVPEYYPTYIRSTAVGVINGIGKVGGALGVLVTLYLDAYNIQYTIGVYIVIIIFAILGTFFLNTETRGRVLVDERTYLAPETEPISGASQEDYGSAENTGAESEREQEQAETQPDEDAGPSEQSLDKTK